MGPPSIRQSAVRLIRRTASRPSRASVGPESRSEATEFREGTPEPSRRRARNSTRAIASAAAVNGCSNPFSAPGALSQSSVFSVILIRTSVFSLDVAHRRWRRDRRRNLDKRGSVRVPSYGSNCGVQGRFGQLSGHKLWRDFQSHAVIPGFSGATLKVAPLFGGFGAKIGFPMGLRFRWRTMAARWRGDGGEMARRWRRDGAAMAAGWRQHGAGLALARRSGALRLRRNLRRLWRPCGGLLARSWRRSDGQPTPRWRALARRGGRWRDVAGGGATWRAVARRGASRAGIPGRCGALPGKIRRDESRHDALAHGNYSTSRESMINGAGPRRVRRKW